MTQTLIPVDARALPRVAMDVLESLYQHRVLSTRQVKALHAPDASLRHTQRVLKLLAERGLAQRVNSAHRQTLWFLSSNGADAVEMAGSRAEHRRRVYTPAQAAGPLRAHTLAVNDVGIAFVRAARQRGDSCGSLSWRHEIAHPIGPHPGRADQVVIADALLTYIQTTTENDLLLHQRFVELDRGTIPADRLALKLARYARLREYRSQSKTPTGTHGEPLWRSFYRSFPGVLVVLAHQTPGVARRRVQRVIALSQSDPTFERFKPVPVHFVTLDDLTVSGPFSPIFIDLQDPSRYVNWLGETQPER